MANQVLLIDTLPNSDSEYGTVFSDYGENSQSVYGQDMRRIITNEGYTGEHAFSVGGNWSNKIYFGATLGISRLKYTEHYEHLEKADYDLAYGFQNFTYTKRSENTGTGISLKIGTIIKPVESVRIGLAFHSPTFYKINSYLYDDIVANFKGYAPDEFSYDPLRFSYALTTPFRALAGIAYQYKKTALLSLDYEFIDYSTARFSETGDGYDYSEKNLDIKNILKPTSNIRLGGEFRMNKVYLRGGYGYYGKAFVAGDDNGDMFHRSISFGAGFREQNLNIDFGYTNFSNSQRYVLYSVYSESAPNNLAPVISDFDISKNIFTVTVGYKFGY
jgi:long-subunit fatty acid transport protein